MRPGAFLTWFVAATVYDAAGNVLANSDPLNHRTSFSYERNSATQTTDAIANVSTTAYDLVSDEGATIDDAHNRTTVAYDVNQYTQTTDALNSISTTLYDAVVPPDPDNSARANNLAGFSLTVWPASPSLGAIVHDAWAPNDSLIPAGGTFYG